jgi:hypothetical protein
MPFAQFNARRLALPAALAAAATTAFLVAGGPLQTFADAFGRAVGGLRQTVARWGGRQLVSQGA